MKKAKEKESKKLIGAVGVAGQTSLIGPIASGVLIMEAGSIELLEKIGVNHLTKSRPTMKRMQDILFKLSHEYTGYLAEPESIDYWINANKSTNYLIACDLVGFWDYIETNNILISSKLESTYKDSDEFYSGDLTFTNMDNCLLRAAYLLAKIDREEALDKIRMEYNIDFGSGYDGDPKTMEFLSKNFDKYPIFRKSYKSYKAVLRKHQK